MAFKRALTKREIQVLRHIMQGRTNAEIAKKLDLSVKTIETHKHNIVIKLGANTPKDLIRLKGRKF